MDRKYKNNPNWRGGKFIPCIICGKEVWSKPSRVRHTCSLSCLGKYNSKMFSGKHITNSGQFKTGQTSGNRHWNWKGGTTKLREMIRKSAQYQKWRMTILERDNYRCVLCNKESNGDLNVDHYPESFSKIIHKNNILSLGEAYKCKDLWKIDVNRTLCESCHKNTPNYLKDQTRGQLGRFKSIYES